MRTRLVGIVARHNATVQRRTPETNGWFAISPSAGGDLWPTDAEIQKLSSPPTQDLLLVELLDATEKRWSVWVWQDAWVCTYRFNTFDAARAAVEML